MIDTKSLLMYGGRSSRFLAGKRLWVLPLVTWSIVAPAATIATIAVSHVWVIGNCRKTHKPVSVVVQTDKQRIIWAYKILFLDVLFPLNLKKVIFVDSDQIIRADFAELWNMDLQVCSPSYVRSVPSIKDSLFACCLSQSYTWTKTCLLPEGTDLNMDNFHPPLNCEPR